MKIKKTCYFLLKVIVLLFVFAGAKSNSFPALEEGLTVTGDSSILIPVPGGTYTQTDGTNSFSHTISAFEIGKYEVTYELWYTVYRWAVASGYKFANEGSEGYDGSVNAPPTESKDEPVTMVSWRDVIVWCNAYSQKSGLTAVYFSDAAFTKPLRDSSNEMYGAGVTTTAGSCDNPYVDWKANGYRLPTEGEWQYAASYKDGSGWTPYNYASGATAEFKDKAATGLAAWYSKNSKGETQAAGGKKSNALGIFDMSGNAYELCWDWYGGYPGTATDYRGPAAGLYRVIRGGGYDYDADAMQVGLRSFSNPYTGYSSFGFRFARSM